MIINLIKPGPMSRPMTVMQVLPALGGGGVERGVLEVAKALVEAGHRSIVVSAGGKMVESLTREGSVHYQMPIGSKTPLALTCLPKLRKLIQDENVDVLDYHSRMPGWICLAAWKSLPTAARPKLISTLHGLHSVNSYSGIMCKGEYIIAVSETVRKYIEKNFPHTPADRVSVIHRGIDEVEFPRGYRPTNDWQQKFHRDFPEIRNRALITLVGRLTRLKGHDDLLKAIRKLRSVGIDVHGLIVGGAEAKKIGYHEYLKSQIKELGIEDAITFTGARQDLKQIYSISSIVVSLSTTPESFGRTVAEALSIGTPVVGYDHGGVSEILAAQFPLGAVFPGNSKQLVSRIRQVLQTDCQPAIPMGVFPREKMLARTLDLYQRTLGQNRSETTTIERAA